MSKKVFLGRIKVVKRHKRGGMLKMRQKSVEIVCVWDGHIIKHVIKDVIKDVINDVSTEIYCTSFSLFRRDYISRFYATSPGGKNEASNRLHEELNLCPLALKPAALP